MSQNGTEDHFFHVYLVILKVSTVDQTYNTEASGTPPLNHTRGTPILWIFRATHPRSLEPQEGAPPPAPGLGMSEFRSLTEQVPRELNSLHDRALPRASPGRGASVSSPFSNRNDIGRSDILQSKHLYFYRSCLSESFSRRGLRATVHAQADPHILFVFIIYGSSSIP